MGTLKSMIVFTAVSVLVNLVGSAPSFANPALSSSDMFRLRHAANQYPSMSSMAQALSAGCLSATQDANLQRSCLVEGQKWMLKYLLAPGHQIPCTGDELRFDTMGMMEQACSITFPQPASIYDYHWLPRGTCLAAAYYQDLRHIGPSRQLSFTCELPALGNLTVGIFLRNDSTVAIQPPISDNKAFNVQCLEGGIHADRDALAARHITDSINLATQISPSVQACQKEQFTAHSEQRSSSSAIDATPKAETVRTGGTGTSRTQAGIPQ